MLRRSSYFLGVVLFALTSAASAINLSLSPATQDATVSGDVKVAIDVSDLVGGAAPSLGVYDVTIAFDPLLLVVSSVEFGDSLLGNQLDLAGFGTIPIFDAATPGLVQVGEISFDSVADLNNLQAGAFTLASLHFTALAPGNSSLTLTVNSFGDADGIALAPVSISNAEVTITGATTVPEPGTLALLGLASGLLALVGRARRT